VVKVKPKKAEYRFTYTLDSSGYVLCLVQDHLMITFGLVFIWELISLLGPI
jgi:hypothetical protein